MKTIDIKGKAYVEVNERIKFFREKYKNGSIITEMLSCEGGMCIFKASVVVDNVTVATGHAYEKEGSTFINKTSYIENCETSAVGRALGILGIGIDTSITTAEEMQTAMQNQKPKSGKNQLMQLVLNYYKGDTKKAKESWDDYIKTYGKEKYEDLDYTQQSNLLDRILTDTKE